MYVALRRKQQIKTKGQRMEKTELKGKSKTYMQAFNFHLHSDGRRITCDKHTDSFVECKSSEKESSEKENREREKKRETTTRTTKSKNNHRSKHRYHRAIVN